MPYIHIIFLNFDTASYTYIKSFDVVLGLANNFLTEVEQELEGSSLEKDKHKKYSYHATPRLEFSMRKCVFIFINLFIYHV